jgi:hypothetical protein
MDYFPIVKPVEVLIVDSSYPPPAHPSQALQYFVTLASKMFYLHSGLSLIVAYLCLIPVTFTPYRKYSLHLLRCPFFYLLLSLLLLRFVVSFVNFTWFSMLKNLKTCTPHITFEILTELKLNIYVSCNMMPCSLVEIYRNFGGRTFWIFFSKLGIL